MEMIRTILVLAIAFAARLAHAEGAEPTTILDMPDLCGRAHLRKGTLHQNVLQDFVPDPGTICPMCAMP